MAENEATTVTQSSAGRHAELLDGYVNDELTSDEFAELEFNDAMGALYAMQRTVLAEVRDLRKFVEALKAEADDMMSPEKMMDMAQKFLGGM